MRPREITERLQECDSVRGIRQLQRDRFKGEDFEAEWLDALDDACMFGAAGVLGMLQHGVPLEQLQIEIVELMNLALKQSRGVH